MNALTDLLLDQILSQHGVLDDLGLFRLHYVDVVLGVHVHNLLNGSLLDPVFDECVLGVRANVFTTSELKGKKKATTRNNQVCQLQVVTVYAQSSMCMLSTVRGDSICGS